MLKSVKGFFRDGKFELLEPVPPDVRGKVVVKFLEPSGVDLNACGIDQTQTADLRQRLSTIADDWNGHEMDAYYAVQG